MTKIENVTDCKLIQDVLLKNGYEARLSECQIMWKEVCDKIFGGVSWYMPPFPNIFERLKQRSLTFQIQSPDAVPTR
jgi:hypothetical protein